MPSWLTVDHFVKRSEVQDQAGTHRHAGMVEECIGDAMAYVEARTGRKFDTGASHKRRFHGTGRDFLPLPFGQVSAVSAVTIGTAAITPGTWAEYYAGTSSLAWDESGLTYRPGFTVGRRNVLVAYQTTPDAVLLDLAIRAGVEVAGLLYEFRKNRGLESRAFAGNSETLRQALTGLRADILEGLLDLRYMDRGVEVTA